MYKVKNKNNYKRFYQVLDRIISKRNEEIEKYRPVMEMLENLGIMSILSMLGEGQVINQENYDRIKLELTKLNIPINEEDIFEMVNWVKLRENTWNQRLSKLIEIQKANSISSLEQYTFEVKGVEHKLYRPSDKAPFKLTDNDLEVLEEQKPKVIDLWLDYCSNNGLNMYQLTYNSEFGNQEDFLSLFFDTQYSWQEISADYISLIKDFYKWAFLIENSIDSRYNLVIGNDKEIYNPECSALMISPTKYELD